MRYNNSTAFLNQIKQAKSAGALSRVYWVALEQEYDRIQIMEKIVDLIGLGRENLQKWAEFDLPALAQHLTAPNLFGDEPVAIIEEGGSIGKGDHESFSRLMPREFGYLIIGAKSKSAASSLVETVGVVLDQLDEKPWDREKRILQALESQVRLANKAIRQDALIALMESQDLEEGILAREIEKLICYTGERNQITVEDVKAICTANRSYAVWQMAEKVVWERQGHLEEAHFHALIPALRAQLQLGLKIATLLAEGGSPGDWASALPRVFPKTLEKRTREVARLGSLYFLQGLKVLFEIELQSRMGSGQMGALLDLFRSSLYSTPLP